MTSRPWMPLASAFAFAAVLVTTARPAGATNCFDDGDCPAATPACNGGLCAECSATNRSACTGRLPTCLLPAGVCGCENDGQCGNATSGLLCTRPAPSSVSAPYCRAGCANGRNGCPSTYACTDGQCKKDCLLASQCTAPQQNLCPALTFNGCRECSTDDDCASKKGATVCDTNLFVCVQCARQTDCAANNHGPVCLAIGTPQGSCGCNSDADCGRDRICDETLKVCMDGCRVAGGGKCPPGNHCLSSAGGGSACVPIDGGTGSEDSGIDAGEGGPGPVDAGDAGSRDAGRDAGRTDGGGENPIDPTFEGGGVSCALSPTEDSLPIGGFFALGGLMAFFMRRRPRR